MKRILAPHKEAVTLCACGCGQPAPISPSSWKSRGYVKGEPRKYISGHNRASSPDFYIVDESTGCWVWQRSCGSSGYGLLRRNGKNTVAHRHYWQEANGRPVPTGMCLDHLCRNRKCVNPDHLEVVTYAENVRRGAGWGGVLRNA